MYDELPENVEIRAEQEANISFLVEKQRFIVRFLDYILVNRKEAERFGVNMAVYNHLTDHLAKELIVANTEHQIHARDYINSHREDVN